MLKMSATYRSLALLLYGRPSGHDVVNASTFDDQVAAAKI
jgi:hypothetical protein